MTDNSNKTFWIIIGFVLFLAALGGLSGQKGGSSSSSSTSVPDSVEYRYARERFRQEGYNSADAETAANAIMKFHEAQKRRAQ